MIKINELRVGNYILFKEYGEGDGKIGAMKRGDFGRFNDEEYHAVHLTPRWLERCGFTWDKGYMKIDLKHARMSLGFYGGVPDKMSLFQTTNPWEGSIEREFGFGSNHPEYLHQLQNLYFALTGEELTLKK